MQLQLRTLPAVLLTAVALTLSACGGSDHPAKSAGAEADAEGTAGSPSATAETAEPSGSAEPTAQATDETEWVGITDEPSGITFEMPEHAEPRANTAAVDSDTSVSLRNYSVMIEGDVELGFNVIDTPGAEYDFDAGVQGVANTLGGEVVSQKETKVDGNAAVDVEMTYGEGYIVFFQLVTGKEHIVQSLASGPQDERKAVLKSYRQLSSSIAGY